MASIRVAVTPEHIAAADALNLNDLSRPVTDALAEVIGQHVDVSGSEPYGTWIATIGDGDWVLVVELPEDANRWLNARWDHEPAGPFTFELVIPEWLVAIVRDDRPLLTLREAAAMLGVKPQTLRQQAQDEWNGQIGPTARARRLGTRKLGRDWFVDRVAVEREVAYSLRQLR